MKLQKRYLCTALSLAFAQAASAGQDDTMTVWSSPVSAASTNIVDR